MEEKKFKTPIFINVYKALSEKINNNEFEKKLPTEKELAIMFNTSRTTIRQALLVLQEYKMIYTIKGSGTYVNQGYLNNHTTGIENYCSVREMITTVGNMDCKIENQSLGIEEADKVTADFLNISYKSIVWVLVRNYTINNEVYACSLDFIPKTGSNKEIVSDLNTIGDFEEYVDVYLRQRISLAETYITATKADGFSGKLMNLDKATPLTVLYQVLKDSKKNPVSVNKTYINTMKTELKLFRKVNTVL